MLNRFDSRAITLKQACAELGLSRSRFYALRVEQLAAAKQGKARRWHPALSGGAHRKPWPAEVVTTIKSLMSATPAASYSFAASEVLRRHQFKVHRASLRRFVLEHDLSPPRRQPAPRASVRRWQREQIGSLWQLDATPHRWLPGQQRPSPLLNMLDDCSRLNVAATLYPAETLLAYLEFLPLAFQRHGMPLQIYVDYHSFFFTDVPENLTQLGAALRFYDMSFRYAPTPQAKGKIERSHQVWQQRLPTICSAEGISDLEQANAMLDKLRLHRNQHETHREIEMTPGRAWKLAAQQGRSVLRAAPSCPWWPYVWSIRTNARIDDTGRVSLGVHRPRILLPRGTKVVRCQHPDGSWSLLKAHPDKTKQPVLIQRLEP